MLRGYAVPIHSQKRVLGYSAKYPVIWCPKYRRRVIGGRVEARLKQIIDEVVTECGGEVIECETMPDHVHLLLELPPTAPLSGLMAKLKGRSSRRLRAEFPQLRRRPALWSPSWFVSTVGGAPLDVVRRYVENQQLARVDAVLTCWHARATIVANPLTAEEQALVQRARAGDFTGLRARGGHGAWTATAANAARRLALGIPSRPHRSPAAPVPRADRDEAGAAAWESRKTS